MVQVNHRAPVKNLIVYKKRTIQIIKSSASLFTASGERKRSPAEGKEGADKPRAQRGHLWAATVPPRSGRARRQSCASRSRSSPPHQTKGSAESQRDRWHTWKDSGRNLTEQLGNSRSAIGTEAALPPKAWQSPQRRERSSCSRPARTREPALVEKSIPLHLKTSSRNSQTVFQPQTLWIPALKKEQQPGEPDAGGEEGGTHLH